MQKVRFYINKKNQSGFSLAEALVAIFIISMLGAALVGAIIYAKQTSSLSGNKARSIFFAQEGLEAARNIRDGSFSNLIDGTYGIATSSSQYIFSGSTDVNDIFTRQVNIATVDSVTKKITSTVTWAQNSRLNGTTTLVTYLGNIGLLNQQSNSLGVSTTSAAIGGAANKELQGITLSNTSASSIVIDKITVTWTTLARTIQAVRINSANVWAIAGPGTPSGSQLSGTQLDIQNLTLTAGSSGILINRFLFDGSMVGNSFTIIFTMSDGSSKTIVWP